MQGVRTFRDKKPTIDTWCSAPTKIAEKGSVLISVRAPVGEVNIAPERMCIGRGLASIRGRNNEFLYYLLLANRQSIVNRETGTVFGSIDRETLKSLSITIPESEDEQDKVAKILGDLDAKIELNRRMSETLEKIGQTLFKHYFIDNPDRKNWKNQSLSSFGEIVCGKTPPKKRGEYFGGTIPFVKIPDMHGQVFITETQDNLTDLGRDFQRNKTVPANTICISCIATVGLVSLTSQPSQTNQQINSIVTSEKHHTYFLYFLLKNMRAQLIDLASGGSATPNLNTSSFSKIPITTPSAELLSKFDKVVDLIFKQILINQQENLQLTTLRDSLLPRLISGKTRV